MFNDSDRRFYICEYGKDPYNVKYIEVDVHTVDNESTVAHIMQYRKKWVLDSKNISCFRVVLYEYLSDKSIIVEIGRDTWANIKKKPRILNPAPKNETTGKDNVLSDVPVTATNAGQTMATSSPAFGTGVIHEENLAAIPYYQTYF